MKENNDEKGIKSSLGFKLLMKMGEGGGQGITSDGFD